MTPPEPVALDACVLLNLLATDRALTEFAVAADVGFVITSQAAREVTWLDAEDPDEPRQELHLEPLFRAGELEKVDLVGQELTRFVALARDLDDGEAATISIADSRGFTVATDDRKALRILIERHPSINRITTPALVRAWAIGRNPLEITACLRAIERRARFVPSRNDPDAAWWAEHSA